jgi:hypothetical protein
VFLGCALGREPGRPLFVSLVVYLDEEWPREWDAETLLLDTASDTGILVRPRCCRRNAVKDRQTDGLLTGAQEALSTGCGNKTDRLLWTARVSVLGAGRPDLNVTGWWSPSRLQPYVRLGYGWSPPLKP